MLDKSDAVVIGSATMKPLDRRTMDIRIEVEESLRGPISIGTVVPLQWERQYFADGRSTARGLFFLKRDVVWKLIPLMTGSTTPFYRSFYFLPQGPPPTEYRSGSSLPLQDRIFILLSWAEQNESQYPYPALSEFMHVDRDFPAETRSPFIRNRLRQRLNDPSPAMQADGVRATLQEGNLDTLRRLQTDHQRFRNDAAQWRAITETVSFYFPNTPGGAAILGQFASTPGDPQLRRAAAIAMARLHSRECLPHLARLMDDPDAELRALGVGGLAMFANNIQPGRNHPAPEPWPFRTDATMAHSAMSPEVIGRDPAKYLGFWKQWWRDNQAKAMSGQ
ncbi:MAG: hypothetical protein FJW39_18780 [Acidobacteria bacterium]|nr:hypothetical protein [Acidobacteriota bacterium]